jgi:hypothetical protein
MAGEPKPGGQVARPIPTTRRVVSTTFLLAAGRSASAHEMHGHFPVADELALGYLVVAGWCLDPMMDVNDAWFALTPELDKAVRERACTVATCGYLAATTPALMWHLYREHRYNTTYMEHWLRVHATGGVSLPAVQARHTGEDA